MRRSARWGMMTAGALALACSSSSARADDTATRDAEARFAEGLSRVKKQDYEGARLSFAQAYTVLHRPLILWNLALSEEKSGHPIDALTHFRKVAQDAPSEADRASARKHIDSLQAKTSRVDIEAPSGTTFTLDGSDVAGTAPLGDPVDVIPGHHVIVAKLAISTKTSEVDTLAGQIAHVTFAADPPAIAAAPAPAASVPVEPQPVPYTPPEPTQHPFWTARTITAASLAGLAVAATGVAIGFGVASQNHKSTADDDKGALGQSGCAAPTGNAAQCSALNDAVNSQNRDANLSNALYFTGGALAVGAIVSWFFWPKPKDSTAPTAWIMPTVSPGSVAVGAGGRF